MKTIARRFLLVLAPILLLGCPGERETTTPAGEPPGPGIASTETTTEPSTSTADCCSKFSNEIYALVSLDNNGFKVSPNPIVVQNASKQTIIWTAEDPDVTVEIEYKEAALNETNPRAKPPAKPCQAGGRKCGGNPVGGDEGEFKYTVKGTSRGQAVPDLDPDVIILRAF